MADRTNGNVPKYNNEKNISIDSFKAAEIARKFFEQYNSGLEVKCIELKNNVWIVVVGIDFLYEQIREIKIDARTGTVIEYS